jgi:hypothetical protein
MKKVLFISLIFILSVYIKSQERFLSSQDDKTKELIKEEIFNKLVTMLNKEVTNFETELPAGAENYVKDMYTSGNLVLDRFSIEDFDSAMTKNNLPESAVKKFRGILFAKSLLLDSFSLVLEEKESFLEEMIASVNRDGKKVELAFIKMKTRGELIPQFSKLKRRKCDKILFIFENCYDEDYYVLRGLTPEEINLVTKILRNQSFIKLVANIKDAIYQFEEDWYNETYQKALIAGAKNLEEKIKLQIEDLKTWLWATHLQYIVNKINAMIKRNREHVNQLIAEVIQNFKSSVEIIISSTITKAVEMKDYFIDLKNLMISDISKQIDELELKVKTDIRTIMTEIDSIKYQLNCFSTSLAVKFRDAFTDDIEKFDKNMIKSCQNDLGKIYSDINQTNISNYSHSLLYLLRKCSIEKELAGQTNIFQIRTCFNKLEQIASEMRCLSVAMSASANHEFYMDELAKITVRYEEYERSHDE